MKLKKKELLAKTNQLKGEFNEYLAKKYYQNQGYRVIKSVRNEYPFGWKLNIAELETFLPSNVSKFLIGSFSDDLKGLPDFICYKEEDLIFVECKSSEENVRVEQWEKLTLLAALGFDVRLWITKVQLECSHSNTEVNFLGGENDAANA